MWRGGICSYFIMRNAFSYLGCLWCLISWQLKLTSMSPTTRVIPRHLILLHYHYKMDFLQSLSNSDPLSTKAKPPQTVIWGSSDVSSSSPQLYLPTLAFLAYPVQKRRPHCVMCFCLQFFFNFVFILFRFLDRISPCSPGWPQARIVFLPLVPELLGLQVCATMLLADGGGAGDYMGDLTLGRRAKSF